MLNSPEMCGVEMPHDRPGLESCPLLGLAADEARSGRHDLMCQERRRLGQIDEIHRPPGSLLQILGEAIERSRRRLAGEQDRDVDVARGARAAKGDGPEDVRQADVFACVEQLANPVQLVHGRTIRGPAIVANLISPTAFRRGDLRGRVDAPAGSAASPGARYVKKKSAFLAPVRCPDARPLHYLARIASQVELRAQPKPNLKPGLISARLLTSQPSAVIATTRWSLHPKST